MTPSAIIDLITALWLGFIGACIGSFLNVVAYRMPRGMSVVWKPSHCPKCSHPIRAHDNVPVFGWLWLKGKCRDCGEPISSRYAIVEFVIGLAFFILAYVELFSGGANLPGGPITELTGAMHIVWSPQWPLIGVYAYHCLLLCLLMVALLCNRDGEVLPSSLAWFGVVVALASSPVFSHFLPSYGNTTNILVSRVLGCLLGIAVGSVVGRLVYHAKTSCGTRPPFNIDRGCRLIGAFLGWKALSSFGVLLIVALTLRTGRRTSFSPAIVDMLLVLALLHIVFENQIFGNFVK